MHPVGWHARDSATLGSNLSGRCHLVLGRGILKHHGLQNVQDVLCVDHYCLQIPRHPSQRRLSVGRDVRGFVVGNQTFNSTYPQPDATKWRDASNGYAVQVVPGLNQADRFLDGKVTRDNWAVSQSSVGLFQKISKCRARFFVQLRGSHMGLQGAPQSLLLAALRFGLTVKANLRNSTIVGDQGGANDRKRRSSGANRTNDGPPSVEKECRSNQRDCRSHEGRSQPKLPTSSHEQVPLCQLGEDGRAEAGRQVLDEGAFLC